MVRKTYLRCSFLRVADLVEGVNQAIKVLSWSGYWQSGLSAMLRLKVVPADGWPRLPDN